MEQREKKWPRRNLCSVIEFFEGITAGRNTTQVVAESVGMTYQAISRLFVQDDMRLSALYRMTGTFGYSVEIVFHSIPNPLLSDSGEKIYVGMAGLKMCVEDKGGASIHSIAMRAGISYKGIYKAIVYGGDVRLSSLRTFSYALGLMLDFRFAPMVAEGGKN